MELDLEEGVVLPELHREHKGFVTIGRWGMVQLEEVLVWRDLMGKLVEGTELMN
jgi:hypothetical protein